MRYMISVIVGIIIGMVILFPKWQVKLAKNKLRSFSGDLSASEKLMLEKDLLNLENTYRLTISQIIGGAVVVLSLYFSLENLNNSQKSLELSQQGQLTDRFTKAVNQLGDKNTDINMGGIFALQRIANESEKDHWPIMEILTAYVRRTMNKNLQYLPTDGQVNYQDGLKYYKPRSDIQAVMTVLSKRNHVIENRQNEVIHLDVSFLQGIVLDDAQLEHASFMSADLAGSLFRNTDLDSAHFNWANLQFVNFENSSMRGINLQGADASYSNLNNAHLENADLTDTDLRKARFQKFFVNGAKFSRTNLAGLDLRNIVGLTKKQLSDAYIDEFTTIPTQLK